MAKKITKKRSRAPAGGGETPAEDDRFSALKFNPKFALPKKNKSKVKVDKRFQDMFTDQDFAGASETAVDKYGRRQKKSKAKKGAELKRFYKIGSDDEMDDNDDTPTDKQAPLKSKEEQDKKKSKEEKQDERLDYLTRLARGEVSGASSSESGDESDSSLEDASDVEDGLQTTTNDASRGEEDEQESTPMGDESKRIAIQDCDWDKLQAQDLLAILNSFAPSTGRIEKVTVYLSEFGEKRMRLEERHGPILDPSKIEKYENGESASENDDGENSVNGDGWEGNAEGDAYDPEKLRKYELDKLKYYFAVVECDTVETASILYRECDGVEYEHSSNVLDLRFIPDEMEIDRPVRDQATDVPLSYKPPEFITKALQQSKVELTWDDDAYDREELQKWGRNDTVKNGEIVTEHDLERFMAPNSSDSESDDENAATKKAKKMESKQKYKKLLAGLLDGDDEDKSGDDEDESDEPTALEATFIPGLTERILERKRKEKLEASETPIDRERRLLKEKRQARRNAKNEDVQQDGNTQDQTSAALQGFNDPFFASQSSKKKRKGKYQKDYAKKDTSDEPQESSKAELELLMAEGDPNKSLKGFDFKTIVEGEKLLEKKSKLRGKKKRRKIEAVEAATKDSFQLDTKDERFGALFTDPSFQIDRTNPQYVETKTMRVIESERAKRRREERQGGGDAVEQSEKPSEVGLDALVKSVKLKATKKKKSKSKY